MKLFKLTLIILSVFFKTQNVLSEDNIFNVNNIELVKKTNISNKELANEAIKIGFNKLVSKILLEKDKKKLSQIKFSQIKSLVSYYQVVTKKDENVLTNNVNFNIFFDKDKIHSLFYKKGILYSEISNKEIYLLPILIKKDQIYIYNNNYFYENWNNTLNTNILEFILPLENIEVIQSINTNRNNLLGIDLRSIFKEYINKNIVLALIQNSSPKNEKIYLKTNILKKEINKNLIIERMNLNQIDYNKRIINKISDEILNIVKSQNLIDIRTPAFLNAKLKINNDNSLVELNSRLKKIDLIDNIFVQEFNNDYILLKIKYLGKLDKIINQLEGQKIILKLIGDQWSLKII